jgi:hypothetical protein
MVTQQVVIEAEIAKARKAKGEHLGVKARPKRRTGFCVSSSAHSTTLRNSIRPVVVSVLGAPLSGGSR